MRWMRLLLTGGALAFCQCSATPRPVAAVTAPDEASRIWWSRVPGRLEPAAAGLPGHHPGKWSFRLVPGRAPNAQSWPDGRIDVTRGTLAFVRSEDELAAVTAHEMAHVLQGHGRRRVAATWLTLLGGTAAGFAASEAGGTGGQALASAAGAAGTVSLGALLPMSRRHELQADAGSIPLLTAAGYDPWAALRFWKRYAAWRSTQGMGKGGWLSPHPCDEARLDALRQALIPLSSGPAPAGR